MLFPAPKERKSAFFIRFSPEVYGIREHPNQKPSSISEERGEGVYVFGQTPGAQSSHHPHTSFGFIRFWSRVRYRLLSEVSDVYEARGWADSVRGLKKYGGVVVVWNWKKKKTKTVRGSGFAIDVEKFPGSLVSHVWPECKWAEGAWWQISQQMTICLIFFSACSPPLFCHLPCG